MRIDLMSLLAGAVILSASATLAVALQ